MPIMAIYRASEIDPETFSRYRLEVPIDPIPDGAISHHVAFDAQGLFCVDVWESEQQLNVFMKDRVNPGLERLGLCRSMLAAADLAAAAQEQAVVLGAPGGVAAAGQVAARLGLHPGDPFGAWPRWLAAGTRAWDVLPLVTVAACRRTAVVQAAEPGAGGQLIAAVTPART